MTNEQINNLNNNPHLRCGIPLRKAGPDTYTFTHKSLMKYFAALAVYAKFQLIIEMSVEGREALDFYSFNQLSQRLLVREQEIIQFLADRVRQNRLFEEQLFQLIESSKIDPGFSIGAANAITILNIAGVNLSQRDFRGIRIPDANLCNAVMTNTDISKAVLKRVLMNAAILDYSSMAGSELEGLEFGQSPFLSIPEANRFFAKIYSNGNAIVSMTPGNSSVKAWKSDTGRKFLHVNFPESFVLHFDISPIRNDVFVAGDRILYLLNSESKVLFRFKGHTGSIQAVAISYEGKIAVSAGSDRTLRIWNCQSGKLHRWQERVDIYSLALSSDGNWALSGNYRRTVSLWECATGFEKFCFHGHSGTVKNVALTPNGLWGLSSSGRTCLLQARHCRKSQTKRFYFFFVW